jgi:hypothetical protein
VEDSIIPIVVQPIHIVAVDQELHVAKVSHVKMPATGKTLIFLVEISYVRKL